MGIRVRAMGLRVLMVEIRGLTWHVDDTCVRCGGRGVSRRRSGADPAADNKGTHDGNKGTGNGKNGTDNGLKGTDNGNSGTDNGNTEPAPDQVPIPLPGKTTVRFDVGGSQLSFHR
jgi:hypothetical protein